MNRKYEKNKRLLVPLGLIGGVIALFIFLHPTFSSTIFAFQRQNKWNTFSKIVKNENNFQSQEYWRFREFYSLGNFVFRENGFSESDTRKILQEIDIPVSQSSLTLPFLLYRSDHFVSLDSLVNSSSLSAVLDQEYLNIQETVLDTEQLKMYKTDSRTVKIIFIKPIGEMKIANGFFDYSKIDPAVIKDKYWINISTVSL